MALAARQHDESPDPAQWLTAEQAASIAGESPRSWRRRAELEHESARQQHRRSLAIKDSPPSGKGKEVWWVLRAIDPRLDNRGDRDRPGLLAKYPAHTVDRAYRRRYWVDRWRNLCDQSPSKREAELAHLVVAEARQKEPSEFNVSVRSMQRWYGEIKTQGIEGLLDGRTVPSFGDGDGGGDGRDQEAIDWFYSLYRMENKLSAQSCHNETLSASRKNGWRWPSSYAATTRWLREYDDKSLTFLLRYGKDRWCRRYMSYLEQDYEAIQPGDLFVCDHHQADFWVTYKNKQIRPWLTAVQDCRSRAIVGWHFGPVPHMDAIIASMRMAFMEWAVPVSMRIDNGKDYCAKPITGVTKDQRIRLRRELGPDWQRIIQRNTPDETGVDSRWLGICGELDIKLIYAIPYAPWSKATLERFFGRFEGQHGKTYSTYCGNNAVNRPECLVDIKRGYSSDQVKRLKKLHGNDWRKVAMLKLVDQTAVKSISEARERVGEWLDTYNRSKHGGLGGMTPMAVWQTAKSLRRAVDDDLLALMETRGTYRVGPNGIRLQVGSAPIGYGKGSPSLKGLMGRDVLIVLNPDDISHCWAFTANRDKRRPIGRLMANRKIAPNTCVDDAREAIAEQLRERKVMRQAERSSAKRTITAEQRMSESGLAVAEELRRTGTDSADHSPSIVPVQTSFEGVSNVLRLPVEPEYTPRDPSELDDLFDDEVKTEPDIDDDMDCLFNDSAEGNDVDTFDDGSDDADDDFESLL